MSLQFEREHRYFVFKVKNLTQDQQQRLYDFEMELGPRNSVGECVVVESDWPNYQDTWADIQAVSEGRFVSRTQLQAERDALAAQVESMRAAMLNACNVIDLAANVEQSQAVYLMERVLAATPQQCLRDVQAEAGRKGYAQALFDQYKGDYRTLDKLKFKPDEYAAKLRQGGE